MGTSEKGCGTVSWDMTVLGVATWSIVIVMATIMWLVLFNG